jgi:hypothetical protein
VADRLGAAPEWALVLLAVGAVAAAARSTARGNEGN